MTNHPMRRAVGCERGAAAVEFAIVSVVLITLMIGIVDFGRTLYVKNHLSFLADQAMRTVLVNPGITNAGLEAELRADFSAGEGTDLTVTITSETVGATDFRVLTLDYPITLFIPNLSAGDLTLSVTRRVPTG